MRNGNRWPAAFAGVVGGSEPRSRRSSRRERLVAVVGHDLGQPLASIEIRLEVLRRWSKDPEFVEDLDGLGASSRRMSRMIVQILDFTRSRLGGAGARLRANGSARSDHDDRR